MFRCHGADEDSRKAKLRLDIRDETCKQRDGRFPIKPGDLLHSEVVRRISRDPDEIMPLPKTGHPLASEEIELLKKWIQQNARYTGHWAFTKPQQPTLPKIKLRSWPKNPIDVYILAMLEENARSLCAHSPSFSGYYRPAADTGRSGQFRPGQIAGWLRKSGGSLAGLSRPWTIGLSKSRMGVNTRLAQ